MSLVVSCGRSLSDAPEDVAQAGAGASSGPDGVAGAPPLGAGGAAGRPSSLEGGDASVAGTSVGGASSECTTQGTFCDGPIVRECAPDGQGSIIVSTCQTSEVCSDGACVPISCVPNALYCSDNTVQLCGADGTSQRVVQRCGTDRYCSADSTGAECIDTWCAPGSALCVNDRATHCNAAGSAPAPGGEDCKSQGELCVDGACKAKTCEPGKKLCQDGDAYFCINGVDTALLDSCDGDEVCDPELAACVTRICTPGTSTCDGDGVKTCNALGTGYQSGTNCTAAGAVCVAGSCLPRVCQPGASFCSGTTEVRRCNDTGTGSSSYQACTPNYNHCYESSGYAYCATNTCTPNLPTCAGNSVVMCNANGDGFTTAAPQACGDSAVCVGSSCQPKVCNNYERFCKDNAVYQCQNGLAGYVYQGCGTEAACKAAEGSASCVPFDCSPGFKTCLKDQLGTCAANGFSLVAATQDCAGQGQVCVSDSACAAQAVDTLGAAEELESFDNNQLFGDVVDVKSNRVLTQLEANLVLAGTRELRFSVYEQSGGYFEARYDKVVRQDAGSGFVGSGLLSYPLKAGRRYLFAVSVSQGGAVASYDATPFPKLPSLGRTAGALFASYASSIYGGGLSENRSYVIRVTSVAP